jgi:hypothetical protein
MAEPRRKYRPPEPGPLQVRESVRRPLLALVGGNAAEARLEVARVEEVERALRCEFPDEILACFANGDGTLPEWGFDLAAVADHTALARQSGCRADLVAVGQNPDGQVFYCLERRGDRRRAVGLVEFDTEENGGLGWRDLGAWLAERAGWEVQTSPQQPSAFVQLTLWADVAPEPRVWRLVV